MDVMVRDLLHRSGDAPERFERREPYLLSTSADFEGRLTGRRSTNFEECLLGQPPRVFQNTETIGPDPGSRASNDELALGPRPVVSDYRWTNHSSLAAEDADPWCNV